MTIGFLQREHHSTRIRIHHFQETMPAWRLSKEYQEMLHEAPSETSQMLTGKPREEVLEAFVDSAVTAYIWISKKNGRLEPRRIVEWYCKICGA